MGRSGPSSSKNSEPTGQRLLSAPRTRALWSQGSLSTSETSQPKPPTNTLLLDVEQANLRVPLPLPSLLLSEPKSRLNSDQKLLSSPLLHPAMLTVTKLSTN